MSLDQSKSMLELFALRLTQFKWLGVACCLLFVIAATIGVSQLQFNGNYRVFFGENDPKLIAFDKMQATYNKSDNVAIRI